MVSGNGREEDIILCAALLPGSGGFQQKGGGGDRTWTGATKTREGRAGEDGGFHDTD